MAKAPGTRAKTTDVLLTCGAAAGPLFVSAFLVEGAVRPGYDPRRHPISSLSLGPTGWTQRLSFWVTGGLYLAGAIGLWRARTEPGLSTKAGPILLGTVGAGLVGAGVFPCDPINGYPPGSPDVSDRTTAGKLHDVCSTPVFLCLPAAAGVYARAAARDGNRVWLIGSVSAAVLQFATFVAAGSGFSRERTSLIPSGGAFQRASIVAGFGWLSALCVRARRSA